LGRRLGAGVGACRLHFLIVDMSCQKRQGAEHLANREGCMEAQIVRVQNLLTYLGTYLPDCRVRDANPIH